MELQNKTIVLTGAASGIGRALAIQLAQAGSHLALADINPKGLEETIHLAQAASTKIKGYMLDVSDRTAWEDFSEQVFSDFETVDMIINNAGIALDRLSVEQASIEEIEQIINVNLWGVIYGTKQFLPHFKTRPEAFVINISSLFGLIGIRYQSAYCTSKFAVRGFTEALRAETIGSKVHVMSVHPGGIATNIAKNAVSRRVGEPKWKQHVARSEKLLRMPPEKAAGVIIKGIRKNKGRVLVGSDAKFVDRLIRWFPSWVVIWTGKVIRRVEER